MSSAYSTPPKPSLIDPVKLSESPGNGIWAPESTLLAGLSSFRGGASEPRMDNHNLMNMLNQTSPMTPQHQQQQQPPGMNMLSQQQRLQMLSMLPDSSSNFASDVQRPNSVQQQHQMLSMLGNMGGVRSGADPQMQQRTPNLPLRLSGNVKSVADLEMEMRLQQLKNGVNNVEGVRLYF